MQSVTVTYQCRRRLNLFYFSWCELICHLRYFSSQCYPFEIDVFSLGVQTLCLFRTFLTPFFFFLITIFLARFLILPDMLKNAPMLKNMATRGRGGASGARGKSAIIGGQVAAGGRGGRGGFGRGGDRGGGRGGFGDRGGRGAHGAGYGSRGGGDRR
jgi:uncharacterized membrane protein YgcG